MADHSHAGHASHEEHHGGVGLYLLVFCGLIGLTTASVLTYTDFWHSHVPRHVGWAFMMAVSCTKAMLVVSFFMHLKWEANWKYVLTIPATIMSIFLVMMLVPDVGRRAEKYAPVRQAHAVIPWPIEVADHAESEGGTAAETPGH